MDVRSILLSFRPPCLYVGDASQPDDVLVWFVDNQWRAFSKSQGHPPHERTHGRNCSALKTLADLQSLNLAEDPTTDPGNQTESAIPFQGCSLMWALGYAGRR